MKTARFRFAALALVVAPALQVLADVDMTPPGPPGSDAAKMKTMNELEPRVAIPQLPFTIFQPGSYYVVSNLWGSNACDGIVVKSDDVNLDLKGFALNGVPGALSGISVPDPHHNVSIRNGVLRGWGGAGINAMNAHESEFVGVTAFTNLLQGIVVGENCLVSDCAAFKNGGCGIVAGNVATVENCKSRDNNLGGIMAGMGTRILDSTASHNGSNGIQMAEFSLVRGCMADQNNAHGIVVASDSKVIENSCCSNAPSGSGAGILVTGRGNRIDGNNVSQNGYGIWLPATATNNLVIRNSSGRNIQGNYYGPGFSQSMSGPLVQGSGPITNLSPWANFVF